jgi:hypothetical protein
MFSRVIKTINGDIRVSIPAMLNELSVNQLIELQALAQSDSNDLQIISVLSGLSLDALYNVCDLNSLEDFNPTILELFNQVKNNYDADLIPSTVTFKLLIDKTSRDSRNPLRKLGPQYKKVTVNVINNLSVEPAGAYMNAKDIIADEINRHIFIHGEANWNENFTPPIEAACKVLAHYFYCHVTGNNYDELKAEAFVDVVKTLPVTDALPIACFFFRSYPNLSKPKASFWQRVRQYSRKKREYKRLKGLNT